MAILSHLVLSLLAASTVFSTPVAENTLDFDGFKDIVWPEDRALPTKITRTPSGGLLAWVKRDTQGEIAEAPPLRKMSPAKGEKFGIPELSSPSAERGPPGTVPFHILTKDQAKKVPRKRPPPHVRRTSVEKRSPPIKHFYGTAIQFKPNYGVAMYFSLFKPNVSTIDDESLIQTGEFHVNSDDSYTQSAECGWQVLPHLNNLDRNPHLFTYFNTNDYGEEGDNLGGYNTMYKGFVQTSDTYYPGMTFTPLSTVGGPQYSIGMYYMYHKGDIWLNVNNVYMGYYPGSLYARNGTILNTLGEKSTEVDFYGEITDHKFKDKPHTDMGSGMFADTGFGQAAYMKNLSYMATEGGPYKDFNGQIFVDDPQWYTVAEHFKTPKTQTFGSYMFVGGPGAG